MAASGDASGDATGLLPVRVTDPGTSPWSFEWLRREVSEPPAYATSSATWLYGSRGGVEVVVRPVVLPGDAAYVAVVAEIDPPVFAGLRIFSRSLVEPFRFTAPTTELGMPPVDRAFIVRAHDRERALRLFLRSTPDDDFAWGVGDAGQRNPLAIDDRTVSSYIAGAQPKQSRIDDDIELVVSLARRFAERGRTLPTRDEEDEARESWSRAAATWSLVFDPARWKISGEHEGRRIEVLLEGIPPSVSTRMRVSFRVPLAAGVFLRSGIREKRKVSASGHRALDELLLFDARDRERGLAALGDPAVRATLIAAAQRSNVTMTDRAVVSACGGFLRGREIAARIAALAGIVDRITPAYAQAGPFR